MNTLILLLVDKTNVLVYKASNKLMSNSSLPENKGFETSSAIERTLNKTRDFFNSFTPEEHLGAIGEAVNLIEEQIKKHKFIAVAVALSSYAIWRSLERHESQEPNKMGTLDIIDKIPQIVKNPAEHLHKAVDALKNRPELLWIAGGAALLILGADYAYKKIKAANQNPPSLRRS